LSLELVKEIRGAEAQADLIKKDAAAQARQISLDCAKACAALIETAKSQAKEHLNKVLRLADAEADNEGDKRRKEIALQSEAIIKAASANIEKAVDVVVDRIVGC
jgi:V/A-type H+-transporting ATPase subunit G/H